MTNPISSKQSRKPAFLPGFVVIAAKLTAAGLPIPVPLQRAVERDPVPLALDTRETWPIWAELHGYSSEQAAQLIEGVRSLVASKLYQEALVVDLAERVDCDGVVTGPVSDGHRASAALALFARALNKANGQPKPGNGKAAAELVPARCCRSGQHAQADTGNAGQHRERQRGPR